jgi:hypothetical protein
MKSTSSSTPIKSTNPSTPVESGSSSNPIIKLAEARGYKVRDGVIKAPAADIPRDESLAPVKLVAAFSRDVSLQPRGDGKPKPLSRDRMKFAATMVVTEMVEGLLATGFTVDEIRDIVGKAVDTDLDTAAKEETDPVMRAAAQLDAMVDATIYMQDIACKHNLPWHAAHSAVARRNLRKAAIDPTDGKRYYSLRVSDGKVIKPAGFAAANPDPVPGIVKKAMD